MSVPKTEPILIVGGGAFGLSTVVHLLKAGYKDITVLDKDDEIPSQWSAANDLNKIVRAEYEDPLYQDLTVVSHSITLSSNIPSIRPKLTYLPPRKPSRLGRHLSSLPIFIKWALFTASLAMRRKKLKTPSTVFGLQQSETLVSSHMLLRLTRRTTLQPQHGSTRIARFLAGLAT
jgi:hypothetical protein